MSKSEMRAVCILFAIVGLLCVVCTSPDNPFENPENAEISLVIKNSKGRLLTMSTVSDTITDSVGKQIKIGVCSGMYNFIDSVRLLVFREDIGAIQDSGSGKVFGRFGSETDTQWHTMTFASTGCRSVKVTAFIANGQIRTAYASINILDVPNVRPVLTILGRTRVRAAETCTLLVSATDSNGSQTQTFSVIKAPQGYVFANRQFIWTPATGLLGTDTVAFTVTDNGAPPLSDTEKVVITVVAELQKPEKVTGLKIVSKSNGVVGLLWNKAEDADSYALFRSANRVTFLPQKSTIDTSVTDTVSSFDYYFYVVAKNVKGVSLPSDTLFSDKVANRKPVAIAMSINASRNGSVPIVLLADDPDGDSLVDWHITMLPAHGKAVQTAATAAVLYIPAPGFNGKDTLTFSVSDGKLTSDTACVIITVDSENVAPKVTKEPRSDTTVVSVANVSVSFFVEINNAFPTPAFTWFKVGAAGSVGFGQKFTKTNITVADSGQYYAIIENLSGKDTSKYAHVTVDLPRPSAVFTVMNIRDTLASRWTSGTLPPDGMIKSSEVIYNDTAFVRVVTATRVNSVKINGKLAVLHADTSARVFELDRIPLPVLGDNIFTIEIVSENQVTTQVFRLTVPSALRPVIAPTVKTPAVGTFRALIAKCATDGDSRMTNVVVLRAGHAIGSVALPTASLPVAGRMLPGDSTVTVVGVPVVAAAPSVFDDSLKPNTRYYYRFISCGSGVSDTFSYGEGVEADNTTKGKITVSATATVTATNVQDGGSDWDWEMYGNIAFCGKNIWSAAAGSYVTANEGAPTAPLGSAVAGTCSPDSNSCTVSFSLVDYDAGSGDDLIGAHAATPITYADILGANAPSSGKYTFTNVKSIPIIGGDQGTGNVNYIFTCTYAD
jgi:hypothetical protein